MNVIELTKKLVSIPSPLGDTSGIEEFVCSRLEQVGNVSAELRPVKGLGNNVIGRVFHGDDLPTILLNGHLDTVEVCKGWSMDPFEPKIEGDRLHGLGSADMKSGVAIALDTFKKLAALGTCNVIFAGTIDEEGDSNGAFALIDEGIQADLCIIPEPSGGTIMMGCRGRLIFEVDVRGASAHGSRPEQGVNAISEAGRFVGELDRLELLKDEKLGTGSFCPLEILGGTRTLSVPDTCWLKIDRHYVRGEDRAGLLEQLKNAVGNMGSHATFDISPWKARPTPFLEPYITENEGLAERFTKAVGSEFSYGKSVGDYNVFAKFLPTVVYGPRGVNWHSPDEWVSIESIQKCAEGYGRFVNSMNKGKSSVF
ncbi:MAG: M20/M25/M40 family metallo-hydrolase [Candidatus Thermoplasmatota archaeon]|nr:M20/M25/M40 family metallo-hydrolase [Candidatus Thermoplasmatota archaeon]MBU4070964.1 M20/M25/M40 family metallo-hydrolase [Candidatus Thermoplasmatota archaeon]MBU4144857.1 M20/M25/M40 family metallo-hydrolase [Candidatus Thermoplasmatota archaeon]MBU4592170.1 M20/M25/M40 family metallo-hydrolase [Candidatus Thermoplasmatota archaeon]